MGEPIKKSGIEAHFEARRILLSPDLEEQLESIGAALVQGATLAERCLTPGETKMTLEYAPGSGGILQVLIARMADHTYVKFTYETDLQLPVLEPRDLNAN